MFSDTTDPKKILEEHRKARGGSFWEFDLLTPYIPRESAVALELSGHVHAYGSAAQNEKILSVQMRELIATPLLAAKGDERFAANHVRKLWRLGVTNAVIVEAFVAATTVVGWSTTVKAIRAIWIANDPSNPEGVLPPGGEPKELTYFPELDLCRDREEPDESKLDLNSTRRWLFAARIDPRLAELVQAYYRIAFARGEHSQRVHLPTAARLLIVIPALCARGALDQATEQTRRALRIGVTPKQLLAAMSCAWPMTGLPTLEIGLEAMMRSGIEA